VKSGVGAARFCVKCVLNMRGLQAQQSSCFTVNFSKPLLMVALDTIRFEQKLAMIILVSLCTDWEA
jgi:hypothetical protein